MANISNYSNKGTSRDERFIPALDDEYFKIDDRTLNDFASFAVKYGTLINYYNEDNKLDGDWSSFFKDDESFILININAFKYKKHQRSFNYLLSEIQTTSNKVEITNIYKVIFNKLFEVFVLIEKWYQLTSLIKEFHRELRNLIKKRFSLVLSKMIVFQDDILKSGIVESIDLFDVSKLSSVWEINTFAHDNHEFLGKSYSEKSNDSAKQFESYIANYIDILRIVIKSSGEYLEKQLFKSGNVKPHIGLFIAFIKLYKFAQDDLNKFLGRHLEYYFKEILKFSYRKEIPDQVYVFLTPTSNLKTVLLPKDTQLIAGVDPDGNQLIYSLIADFSLNHASIQKILGVINETSKPVFDLALNKIGLNQKYIIDNSLCLENLESIKKIQENDSLGVKMGFAISSSILLLSEGLRRVNLNFEFSKQSFNDFIGCMTEFISKNYNSNVKITDLILNPFAISYSTEDDNWFEIPDEDIEIQIIKHEDDFLNRIEFKLFIGTTYPPVLPHIESDFIDSNKLKLPVFRFHYKHDNNSFYNFYKLLSIETIDIEVDVLGVKNLIVQNDYGPLDVSSPFDPFGPIPSIGSSFYIGHENIFNHNLNELRIQFDWFNIPPNDLGFYEYYQGYDGVENNDVFKAKISILDNYRWFPDENQQIISLFESVEDVDIDVDPVNNYRLINNIDTIRLSIAKTTKCNTDTIYSKSTRNGFIKLELCY
ncbi:MAG: hypothetical protein K9J13_09075, partial [Saprospiraceae bacterium]|nr:hypothetical protein [Saprospiraceae bacterium]